METQIFNLTSSGSCKKSMMIIYFCQSTYNKKTGSDLGQHIFSFSNHANQVSRVIMTKLMEWCWFREVRVGHNYLR